MTDIDILYISEESKQKIREIHSSPTSLSFGKYRIQIESGLLRYFLYVWREIPVAVEPHVDLTSGSIVWSSDDFWDAFVTTPYHNAKATRNKLVETEVGRDEWLAS